MPPGITEFYQSVFKQVPNLLLVLDKNGVLKDCNNHSSDLLGYDPEKLIGKKLEKIVSSDYIEKAYEKLISSDGSSAPYSSYLELTGADGERVPANVRIKELNAGQGTPPRTLWVFEEIAERQLKDLEIKWNRVKKKNEDLEELTRVLSHDLREPVRSIHSYVDLLLDRHGENLSSKSRQRLFSVKKNAKRIKNLMDDLSEISQLGTDISRQLLDVPKIVNNVADELRGREGEFEIEVQDDYPRVHFDPKLMKTLLRHLIANSIKFSETPTNIFIGYRNAAPGEEIELFVRDNGEGVPEKYQSRVFEAFQSLKSPESQGTTGIGLAISKRIVEENGGEIWLESEPGKGTTVYFTVPIYENPDGADKTVPELSFIEHPTEGTREGNSELIDPQTGLYNSHYLKNTLTTHLKSYSQNGNRLSFLLIKLCNYGELKKKHDKEKLRDILNQLTTLFMGSIRESDLIMRFSSNQFLLVLPGMTSEVNQVKNRIKTRIDTWNKDSDLPDHLLELSFGSALVPAQNDLDIDTALREAERKLY